MRPKRLTLSAFGSFSRRATVDFERVGDSSLLLIHGQTGGGKTTLLDGMCFALYGETSGGARTAREMRSHHAPEAARTEVSFEFSVRGRDYLVRRSFRLVGPKGTPKGTQELLVKQAPAAAGDDERDHDAAGDASYTTVATKVTEIERHVHELLGLDATQFRQVVVLPQGRFRELLEASSRDREAILETLFDTARFREVEEALKASSSDVREEVLRLERARASVLDHAGADSPEELVRSAEEARGRAAKLAQDIADGRALLGQREAALVELRERKARFEELARVQRELAELSRLEPSHERRVERLAAARRAAKVADVARRRREARDTLESLVRKHVQAVDAAVTWASAREEARAALAREQAREAERRSLEQERARLASALERARALEDARAEATAAEAERAALAEQSEQLEARRRAAADALEQGRVELSALQALFATKADVRARVGDAERRLTLAQAFARLQAERARLDEKLTSARAGEALARAALAAAEVTAADVERRWLDGVAAHLAARLEDGDACPVCGALEHPALPLSSSSSSLPPPREAVEAARERVRTAREIADEARERTRALEHERARADERLASHAGAHEDGASLSAAIAEAREALARVEDAGARARSLADAVARREAAFRAAEQALDALAPRTARADARLAAAHAVVTERARGLCDDGDARGEGLSASLSARLSEVSERLTTLAAARARAEDAERTAAAELTAARSLALTLEGERAEREAAFRARELELRDALAAAGFDDEAALASARLSEAELQRTEGQVREYEGRSLSARARARELEGALAGLQLEDPGPLEAEVRHRRTTLEELHKESGLVEGRVALLEGFCEELTDLEEALTAARRRFGVVGRLAEAALGEHPGRVTFQRWVLGALLDGVLELASERLTVMTRGRYTLHRMAGPVARKRSQGLDLAVLDAHTGRERPVSTLSGGESFLTALSLALGLADAVQARAGGVQLEAIFVDEGFGGLDPESMDLALDALVRLKGTGRLVGIISHVAELQERIDSRLEVIPTRTGSELAVA